MFEFQTNRRFCSLLAAASAMLIGHAAEAQQVGTAAAVNPAAQARGTGGSRTIVMGQAIAHKERIQTTSAGSVQLLFLDKTSMTIGPNSDLAIDEYVYDPNTNTGKLAATLSKGVMRFVGGQISHAGNAQVSTPNAVVGVRGGVAIFQPLSVFIGYGEGEVRSAGITVLLGANEYTQTLRGAAPTPAAPPPPNFLQQVLANLQSQAGQGGGARATAGQVNNARTVATGSATGGIATNVQQTTTQVVNTTNTNNTTSNITQTVQTTNAQAVTQTVVTQTVLQPENLTGFTAGMSTPSFNGRSEGAIPIAGIAMMRTDPVNNRTQVNFIGTNGTVQFGSTDPNLPSGNITIPGLFDVVGATNALLPAVGRDGKPLSTVNGTPVLEHTGLLVEFRPGTQFTRSAQQLLGGAAFCDCAYTRWGFWTSDLRQNLAGNIRESINAFWVAGRPAQISDVPGQGTATYVGHAVAQIQNGPNNDYAASGAFQNVVNFGTRTGQFTITGLDRTNYSGTVAMQQSDPRTFSGAGFNVSQTRAIALFGSFFQGRTSPIGEMGGGLVIGGVGNNNSTYLGAGIFAARRQ